MSFCSLLLAAPTIDGQIGARDGEWRTYGGDLGNTRYSPLDQINRHNFGDLEVAWRFKTDSLGPRPEFNFQSTPLVVQGRLYSTAGSRRAVVALDAATGEMLWMHSQHEGERGEKAPRQLSGRGLAYWTDGKEERILYVTPGYRLVALDAKTGTPVRRFGSDGVVDLKRDFDQEIDLIDSEGVELVLTDIVMPGMSGVELAGRLRDTHPHLPVLLATGYSDEVVDRRSRHPVIAKPYGPRELSEAISTALSLHNDRAA